MLVAAAHLSQNNGHQIDESISLSRCFECMHRPRLTSSALSYVLIIAILVANAFVHAAPGQPANQKATTSTHKNLPTVSFGKNHGFFDAPFSLTLSTTNGSSIRYTVDGTSPSKSSGTLYSKPIEISQTTVVRAIAIRARDQTNSIVGLVDTRTYIFPADVLQQSADGKAPPNLPARWGRARVDYGMDPRIVFDPKNSAQMIPALKSLPSFSLVLDPGDLFGDTRGVYSNPEREGRSAERQASLELIDPAGNNAGFHINCGARIRGGVSSSAWNPKHGFRIFFRDQYGASHLKYPVFGTNAATRFDCFDLRCAQNHSWHLENEAECVFVRDQFNRDLQAAVGQPSARGSFCHLYLNGQYWGLYDTCERPEASYAASYFGGSKTNYDAMKVHGVGGTPGRQFQLSATDGNDVAWKKLYFATRTGLNVNSNYFRLLGKRADGTDDPKEEVLLDPTNLIDYMLLIFYSGNYDAPVTKFFGNQQANNWHAVRKRGGREGFRFFIWDAEHALLDPDENRLGPFPAGSVYAQSNPQWLWQKCLENAEFRMLIADRIQKHFFGSGVLTVDSALALFNRRIKEIELAVLCESARWGDSHPNRPIRPGPDPHPVPFTRNDWYAEVKIMRENYFPKRTAIVLRQFQQAGLMARVASPNISVTSKDASKATITIKAERGEVFYTTDGTDPRAIGGQKGSSALAAAGTIEASLGSVVKVRAKSGDSWSALAETKIAR